MDRVRETRLQGEGRGSGKWRGLRWHGVRGGRRTSQARRDAVITDITQERVCSRDMVLAHRSGQWLSSSWHSPEEPLIESPQSIFVL